MPKPTSFKVFIAVITHTVLVLIAACLFSFYRVDKKYTMILAFFMFVALSFTTVGIYSGLNYKSEEKRLIVLNKVGMIGNLVIFLFTSGIMAYAAFNV